MNSDSNEPKPKSEPDFNNSGSEKKIERDGCDFCLACNDICETILGFFYLCVKCCECCLTCLSCCGDDDD